MITTVPLRYPGALRRVYPGFLQVAGFVSMNLERHVRQHMSLYKHLVRGDDEEAALIADFYDEYFAVLDMRPSSTSRRSTASSSVSCWPRASSLAGQLVEPAAIRRTALLTVEGEKDDVCGVGPDPGRPGSVHRDQAGQEAPPPPARRRPLRGVQRQPVGAPDLPDRAQLHPGQPLTAGPDRATARPRARRTARGPRLGPALELHLQFLDVVGLEPGRRRPLDHLGQGEDGLDIVGGHGAES